ncbi:MAG: hypothetical protein WEA09_14045 [Gemmatimonadota bacterium]
MRSSGIWIRGTLAGLVGATAMALWFLVIDAAAGVPFRTPSLLANSILGVEDLAGRVGPIIFYTLVHYTAFVLLGVGAVWVIRKLEVAPGVLLGLVLGFLLFDVVFFGSVYLTGLDVTQALGWLEVLAGNMIAGVALMGYLHLTGEARAVSWWEALADHRMVREGIVAGLIGAAAVALWFFVFDAVRGTLFFTPGALGSALFLGASNLAAVDVNIWTVTGYTILHFSAFAVVGLIASAIAWQSEKTPPLLLGAVLLFVTFEALFLGLLAIVAEYLLGALAWWTIALGNLFAVVAMGYFLWRRHPRLRDALAADPFDHTH